MESRRDGRSHARHIDASEVFGYHKPSAKRESGISIKVADSPIIIPPTYRRVENDYRIGIANKCSSTPPSAPFPSKVSSTTFNTSGKHMPKPRHTYPDFEAKRDDGISVTTSSIQKNHLLHQRRSNPRTIANTMDTSDRSAKKRSISIYNAENVSIYPSLTKATETKGTVPLIKEHDANKIPGRNSHFNDGDKIATIATLEKIFSGPPRPLLEPLPAVNNVSQIHDVKYAPKACENVDRNVKPIRIPTVLRLGTPVDGATKSVSGGFSSFTSGIGHVSKRSPLQWNLSQSTSQRKTFDTARATSTRPVANTPDEMLNNNSSKPHGDNGNIHNVHNGKTTNSFSNASAKMDMLKREVSKVDDGMSPALEESHLTSTVGKTDNWTTDIKKECTEKSRESRMEALLETCQKMEQQIKDGTVSVGALTKRVVTDTIKQARLSASEGLWDDKEEEEIYELFKSLNFKEHESPELYLQNAATGDQSKSDEDHANILPEGKEIKLIGNCMALSLGIERTDVPEIKLKSVIVKVDEETLTVGHVSTTCKINGLGDTVYVGVKFVCSLKVLNLPSQKKQLFLGSSGITIDHVSTGEGFCDKCKGRKYLFIPRELIGNSTKYLFRVQ